MWGNGLGGGEHNAGRRGDLAGKEMVSLSMRYNDLRSPSKRGGGEFRVRKNAAKGTTCLISYAWRVDLVCIRYF